MFVVVVVVVAVVVFVFACLFLFCVFIVCFLFVHHIKSYTCVCTICGFIQKTKQGICIYILEAQVTPQDARHDNLSTGFCTAFH